MLARACAADPDDPAADAGLDVAADVVADLAFWWSLRGRCREGHDVAARLTATLAARGREPGARLRWAHAFQAVYAGDVLGGLGLAAALADDPDAGDDVRSRAMILLGMAQAFADPAAAEPVVAAAAELARQAADRWAEVEALQVLAYTHLWRGDHAAAVTCADAALPALEQLGHHQLRAWDAAIRAEDARLRCDVDAVLRQGRAGWALAAEVGEPVSACGAVAPVVRTLCRAGRRAHRAPHRVPRRAPRPGHRRAPATGEPERALAAADRAREQARAAGAVDAGQAADLARCVARHRLGGDTGDALAEVHEVLSCAHAAGYAPLVVDALDVLAGLVLHAGRAEPAVRLQAAAAAARDRLGFVPSPDTGAVDALDPEVRDRARTEGASLDLDAAVAYARRARGRRRRPASGWDSLTPTERDVVALVARGLRNQAIADELLMGTGTVRTHLRRIFAKLDLTSRAELAALGALRAREHFPS